MSCVKLKSSLPYPHSLRLSDRQFQELKCFLTASLPHHLKSIQIQWPLQASDQKYEYLIRLIPSFFYLPCYSANFVCNFWCQTFIRNTSYAVCPKIFNQSYLSFYLSSAIVLMYSILFVYSKRYFFWFGFKINTFRGLYINFYFMFS